MLGVPLGILIGFISGFVSLLLINTAWNTSIRQVKNLIILTGEILAIPTFWFGGPWLTTNILGLVSLDKILSSYLIALACTFVPIAIWPMIKMVIRIGENIGNLQRSPND